MTQAPLRQTPWLGFAIDRSATTPVFEQICAAIRSQVASGDMALGSKLPPTRVFATELGVSRSTIVTAYEQLVAEGYLSSQQGSGYRLCASGEVELAQRSDKTRKLPGSVLHPQVPLTADTASEAARLAGERAQDTGGGPSVAQTDIGLRPFRAGNPDMRLFPYRQWAKTVARICRSNPQPMFVGSGGFGSLPLRQAICDHVAEWRGISARPEQVVVTAGATDALEICLHTLSKAGDSTALEDPGYKPLLSFIQGLGMKPEYLRIDENGAVLPAEPTASRLAILTPSHQFPLGGAMSPSRRLEFIQWAAETDAWIIEDDYDSEFRYAGRPIPAMAGFDQLHRTLYIGSFSKIFSNALRLGYLILPQSLVQRFHHGIQRFGPKVSSMPQQPLAEFINSGEFYRHLRRVRRIYAERRRFLLERLQQDFNAFGYCVDHQAGMQVVFHLTCGLRDDVICARAAELGLTIDALSGFVQGAVGRDGGYNGASNGAYNGLVLGFCGYDQTELDQGLQLLQQIF
ncbi:PLP-dependent aminotransferase family protein [Pseudophaeobacter leonis]|uniref:MocR-like pyridoxine biosynthesis transcription factor PdxR n=1 Tax=Pseudophaeobacter leonis TaxID=1144477 RepID=UPI001F4E6F52|nr:PLP-dependent aminotransferase family protein [Pseudophaeobacter leonis]